MRIKLIVFLFLCIVLLTQGVFAQVPYYIDNSGNTVLKVNLTGQTQYYDVNTTGGSPLTQDNIYPFNDGFNGASLNGSWTAYQQGGTGTVSVSGGNLNLAGQANTNSSANVVLTAPTFTSGQELAVNETISNGYYADTSFGSGSLVAGDLGTAWQHTTLANNGGFFYGSNGLNSTANFRNGVSPATTTPTTLVLNNLSYYVTPGTPHTLVMGYDANGTAYENLVNVHITGTKVKLDIPTPAIDNPDGTGSSGQVVHPDVLYFANGWHGYKYWMVITGYYKSYDITENPYLFCSNDGLSWIVPAHVNNPISLAPGLPSFQADPDMVYDPVHDRLVIFYAQQLVNGTGNTILRFNYYDGNSISSQHSVNNGNYDFVHGTPNNAAGAPSFLYNSANGKWYCFGCDTSVTPHRMQRWESADGTTFNNLTNITILNAPTNAKGTMDLWHADIEVLPDGSFNVMCCMSDPATTGTNGTLYLGRMSGYNDTNLTIQPVPLVTIGATGTFYGNRIYRSSSITDVANNTMKVWWSCCANINGGTYNYWSLAYSTFSKNGTGVWVPNTLDVTLPKVRIATYNNYTYLGATKNWMLSQGADNVGNGGTRTINYVYLRQIGHDPIVSVQTASGKTRIAITPSDLQSITNYNVLIPANLLTATTTMDIEPSVYNVTNTSSSTITDGYHGTTTFNGSINYQTSPTYTFQNQYLNASKVDSLNVNVTPLYTGTDPYSKVNTTGLRVWYKFDDGSGNNAVDSSGNGNTGTFATANHWWNPGKYNGSASFNNGKCNMSTSPVLNSKEITVICWVNESAYHQYGSYVSDYTNTNPVFMLGYENPQGTVSFYIGRIGNTAYHVSNANFTMNKWHMLVGNFNGNYTDTLNCPFSCWVDLNKSTTTLLNYTINNVGSGYPQVGMHANNFYVNACIDNVMIYNRSLSDAEITSLYYDGLQQLQLNTTSNSTLSGYVNGSATNLAVPYGASDASITGFTATVPSSVVQNGVTISNYTDNVMPFYIGATIPLRSDVAIVNASTSNSREVRASINPTIPYDAGGTFSVSDNPLAALNGVNLSGNDNAATSSFSTPTWLITAGRLLNGQTYTYTLSTDWVVASFTASPLSGYMPLLVNFTDASTGVPISRSWNFGDGGLFGFLGSVGAGTSTDVSPSYIFTGDGVYTVTLTLTNAAGSNSYTQTINVTALNRVIGITPKTPASADNLKVISVNTTGASSNQTFSLFGSIASTITSGYGLASLIILVLAAVGILRYLGYL